jgi:hypothetical protein
MVPRDGLDGIKAGLLFKIYPGILSSRKVTVRDQPPPSRVEVNFLELQNYWAFGLCPSPRILNTKKHSVVLSSIYNSG